MKLKILFAIVAASLSLNAADKDKLPGPLFDGLGLGVGSWKVGVDECLNQRISTRRIAAPSGVFAT